MSTSGRRFAIGETDFLLDEQPWRILSGSLHYFRIHPDQWADRIAKARGMGLNTIETYVAWNAHSPRPGVFETEAGLDLGRFLDLVAEQGMNAIVRPGPYICAEWDNGGLPAWLFQRPGTGIRSSEPTYLAAVTEYYQQLAPILVPRQIDRGGPIILMQVENEYGAYGDDKAYLKALAELNREIGVTVPLITVDQPTHTMLENGSLPELHLTGSFGSRVPERLETLRKHQQTGPLMCSEFWNGWFDSWGLHHHTTPVAEIAHSLDELLARGGSVNIYMLQGGTNFGFTNGANHKGTYAPIVTSYDYDAPLDEAGNPTEKYWAMRDVISKYAPVGEPPNAEAAPRPTFSAPIEASVPLWAMLDRVGRWSTHQDPPTCDDLGHYHGFMLYRTELDYQDTSTLALAVSEVRDRAQVFLDRDPVGVLSRDHHEHVLPLPANARGTLDVLVEDLGRVDYGPRIGEPKGLIGPARVNGRPLTEWEVLPLDLDDIEPVAAALREEAAAGSAPATPLVGPAFGRAVFDLPETGDLFLDTHGWGKGVVWINGFCLGRYWSRGPQRTLYVPGPVLREHGNELVVLELHATAHGEARFVPQMDLGPLEF
ncbi:glycoside hydrolase family 35 protein [Actinospica robiniae]|uniref:glycoside hydrolase family 35 protein n=1 Tax=Actinospica robiniae TaxID=304901 RepID=UPI0004095F4E|nr:beta-galactosidase family protein [Actinospica robiniae]